MQRLDFRPTDILYYPDHTCPACGAAARPDEEGRLYLPFVDLFGSALRPWAGRFGYVRFACSCPHQPGPGLRVARLGEALLPLPFVSGDQGGQPADHINARRVALALHFLARHARPDRLTHDPLRDLLIAVACEQTGVDQARQEILSLMKRPEPRTPEGISLPHFAQA